MFGLNRILKKVETDGFRLHIVAGSPFRTIQGEGPYTGWPAVFVRLHGCNLACTFCDTNFDHPDDPILPIDTLAEYASEMFGVEEHKLLVITGGEPLRQNILPFIRVMRAKVPNVLIQIETAGTLWIDGIEDLCAIVCSPKTPVIHPKVHAHAIAFKYLIDYKDDHDTFVPVTATQANARPARLALPRTGAPIYLSPMDNYDDRRNTLNRKLVAQLALQYGAHAGVQLHKLLELD